MPRLVVLLTLAAVLVPAGAVAADAGDNAGLLAFDTRWEYPHYLTFRPGNGQACAVNPPRFSWPYTPHVIGARSGPAAQAFVLQLSRRGDFAEPDVTVRTPYNFYNALPVLEKGTWHWRVGYEAEADGQTQWSASRSFIVNADSVPWDRTVIRRAAEILAAKQHPRFGPADGDWAAWRKRLAASEPTGGWLASLVRRADRAAGRPWWNDFPSSDRPGKTTYDDRGFATMGFEIAAAAFAHRFTEKAKYARAKDLAVALARFPKGGLSSPEYHGPSTKWPTQITEDLALVYDLLYEDLSAADRRTLLDSIAWRLEATYLEKASWRRGHRISRSGVGVFSQSHPYENFMWSLPAVLLTAGDLPVSDQLVPLCLHYLTGVTAAHGPDEGWNEGLCYGAWKAGTMVQTAAYTAILLPELDLGRSPYFRRLGTWHAHLLPIGVDRLAFGDYAAMPDRALVSQRNLFRCLARLTGDGRFVTRHRALATVTDAGPTNRAWLDLAMASRFEAPEPQPERPVAVFPEAGWVMAGSQPPSDRQAFDDAIGMIFKCRPRGGYSHSFRAENDFVWYALGRTLSAGGGGTAYPDPHSRHAMSHNVVLVDGEGQEWDRWDPRYPYCGRLLAWRRGDDWIHWVGDATRAYQTVPGLARWHRHVVFLNDRWFVLFDDLAMRPDADPARFSWLYHVAPNVKMEIDTDAGTFAYRMGATRARLTLATPPGAVEVRNMTGRYGFRNPITGEDIYDRTLKALEGVGRALEQKQWMAHNLWVTNRQPVRAWSYLAVLSAWRDGQGAPDVTIDGPRAVRLRAPGGEWRRVSFDPDRPGDVTVDLAAVRAHAEATDPTRLPARGRVETVDLAGDTYRVEWLARETFDRQDWVSRWRPEGDSEVTVRDGRLCVRNLDPAEPNVATIWYRPPLPANVLVRFRAEAVPPADRNAANLNVFLHAREKDGSPLRFGRSGDYKAYHEIPNYIVTFVGGHRPGWSRARRNPGFRLLHEADVRSEVGREYRIAVAMKDGRLRYYVDGQRLHDVTDADPLPGGRLALRTWSTNAWWDDVEIGRILPETK